MRVADSLVFWLSHIVRWFTVWTTAQHLRVWCHTNRYIKCGVSKVWNSSQPFRETGSVEQLIELCWSRCTLLTAVPQRFHDHFIPLQPNPSQRINSWYRNASLKSAMVHIDFGESDGACKNMWRPSCDPCKCAPSQVVRVRYHDLQRQNPRSWKSHLERARNSKKTNQRLLTGEQLGESVTPWESQTTPDHWTMPITTVAQCLVGIPGGKHRLHRPSCWSAPCEGVTRRNMKRSAKDLNANVNKNACGWQVWLLVPARLFWKIQKVTGDNRHEKCINSHCPSSWALSQECARPNLPASEDTFREEMRIKRTWTWLSHVSFVPSFYMSLAFLGCL